MSLIECKECGEQVSTKAKMCPKCGARQTNIIVPLASAIAIIIGGYVYYISKDNLAPVSQKENKPAEINLSQKNIEKTKEPLKETVLASKEQEVAVEPKEVEEPKKIEEAWTYFESKDDMSGTRQGYVTAYSNNDLVGWLRNGKIVFGYNCNFGFYAVANDLGFARHDTICGKSHCSGFNNARVKFDSGDPKYLLFQISDKTNDQMWLHEGSKAPKKPSEEMLLKSMKSSNKMYVEFELYGTKGSKQIAEFDLSGFISSIQKCANSDM